MQKCANVYIINLNSQYLIFTNKHLASTEKWVKYVNKNLFALQKT